jgi:hypothetical protein
MTHIISEAEDRKMNIVTTTPIFIGAMCGRISPAISAQAMRATDAVRSLLS